MVLVCLVWACSSDNESSEALSDWMFSQRAFPSGKINNKLFHQEKMKVLSARNNRLRSADNWKFEGPENIGGRITDIEMYNNSFDNIWIGTASGGAFKSSDRGLNWEEMTSDWGSPPIGDIAVRQTNPNEVWIGTGESNAGSGSIAYEGFGLLRSMNGGSSFQQMGLENTGSISKIALHPSDPSTIYVAAMGYLFEENSDRGIFRSKDGGRTWENILYLGSNSGGSDIIIDPNNPDVIYASIWERIKYPDHKVYWGPSSGIYKSGDGGNNWSRLTAGLPTVGDSLGRIGLAMAPGNSLRLYALVTGIDGIFEGFYSTYNGGQTWIKSNEDLSLNYRNSGYWFCNLTVDPADDDKVFLCGLDMIKTEDAGASFEDVCEMHVDHHAIYVHPMNPQFGLVGNDGGLYLSNNQFENCIKYQNLPITQFYTCSIDPIDPSILYGGTQDNNPMIRPAGQSTWDKMLGGDGFVTLADPRNNDIIYSEYQYGNLFKSFNGGRRWSRITDGIDLTRSNWNSPFMFEPGNADVLYFGSSKMHKTLNGGQQWEEISPDLSNGPGGNLEYGTISSLDVSKIDVNTLIAGTDDGNVWISQNGGSDWNLVSSDLPELWVTRVVCDPHDLQTFYVAFSGLKWHDYLPHIMRSEDGGMTWQDIGQDLPEVPVNDIIIDPEDDRRYWLATDLGVFESYDAGETWEILGADMPVAIINDLDFDEEDRMLLAATYGRSMYSIIREPITTSQSDHISNRGEVYISKNEIVVSGFEGMHVVEIYDVNGQLLFKEKYMFEAKGSHQIDFDLNRTNRAIVVVVRNLENQTNQSFKLMK